MRHAVSFSVILAATFAMADHVPAAEGPAGGLRQPIDPGAAGRRQIPGPDRPDAVKPGQRPAPQESRPSQQTAPGAIIGREPNRVSASTTVNYRGTQLLFTSGQWYQKRGNDLVAIAPPSGVLVEHLPEDYSVRWIAGVPYFHSNGLYFLWRERQNRYEILQSPPPGEPRAEADEPLVDPDRQPGATR